MHILRKAIVSFVTLSLAIPACQANARHVSVDDLWNNVAHFEQVGEIDWASMPHGSRSESSSSFAVHKGIWYAFNRVALPDQRHQCPSVHMATIVRKSRDQGKNWSDPRAVASPGTSKKGDGCAILDGGTYFDEASTMWHLLAQCSDTGNQGGWALCHYTRKSRSPMGRFTPDSGNPVIRGGDLWSRICGLKGEACPRNTIDEGTPEIIAERGGTFIVTFHGFDYASRMAFRGVASTTNFRNWIVGEGDLPQAPLLSNFECRRSLPGCVGVGQASTLFTKKYMYILAESMDKSLQCQTHQRWNFYLFRTKIGAFPRSGSPLWQSYTDSAFLNPSSNDPNTECKITYARWIQDGDLTYLVYEDRIPNSIRLKRRLFKLVPGGGSPIVLKDY